MSKILVVEDDAAISMGIKYTLAAEKFQAVCVSTVEEARACFKNEEISIILLDLMLPDGSGYEFCKEIRTKSNIPIIFLTALDEEVNVVMGFDMGADDYITKPFRIKELISRIKAVLRRSKENFKEEKLISKDITIDMRLLKAYKNGEEIVLTPMEFKLLALFLKNKGKTLERNLILQRIWDVSEEFIDDNTLSVYIKRLREKIGGSYIVTERGIGYRWEV